MMRKLQRPRRLPHPIRDVGEDGRANVSASELRELLEPIPVIARDTSNPYDRRFCIAIWKISAEPGWRPTVAELQQMRRLRAELKMSHKARKPERA